MIFFFEKSNIIINLFYGDFKKNDLILKMLCENWKWVFSQKKQSENPPTLECTFFKKKKPPQPMKNYNLQHNIKKIQKNDDYAKS